MTHVFKQVDMQEPSIEQLPQGLVAVYSCRAPDKPTVNEDAAAVMATEKFAMFAVADGLGGSPAGEQAAAVALDQLKREWQRFEKGPSDALLRTAVLNGFESANEVVQETAQGRATTLLVATVEGSTVRTYHAGDSMALVVGGRGKLKLQTMPHSIVGYAVEAGLLSEQEAMHHEERHFVHNTVGSKDMRVEVGFSYELAPRDSLLLASDGLLDNLHLDEICQIVGSGDLREKANELLTLTRKRMQSDKQFAENGKDLLPHKPDDMTFIIYRPYA